MNVVGFKDSTYGIRKFSWCSLSYVYKDMRGYNQFWWPMKSAQFNYGCKNKEHAYVLNYYHAITDKGSIIE